MVNKHKLKKKLQGGLWKEQQGKNALIEKNSRNLLRAKKDKNGKRVATLLGQAAFR